MAKVTLSVDEIKFLGSLIGLAKSPISPLFSDPSSPLKAVNTQRLIQLGVLNQGGQITPAFGPTFQALSQAHSYAGFGYIGSVLGFEAVTFFGQGRAVSLTNTAEGMEISDPAPTDVVIESLAQRVGRSAFAIADLELELTTVESLVLIAVIDLFRRVQLAQMLEQKVDGQLSIEEIAGWVQRGNFPAPWLMGHFQIFLGKKISCSKEDVHKAVVSLGEKGAIRLEGNRVFVEEDVRMLVSRFLVIDHLVDIKAGRVLPDGSVINVKMEVVQGGLNDLLLWEREGEGVFWKLISPDILIGMASGLLSQAESLKAFDKLAEPAAPKAAASSHCSNCGMAFEPGGKFCKGCGTPAPKEAAAQENICPQCKSPLKPGAKFCPSCGAKTQVASEARLCAQCGASLKEGAKFCNSCGKPVS